MAARKLKIQPKYRSLATSYNGRIVPELRLSGVWLEELGFKVGEQVLLVVSDQEIIIKPAYAQATADKPLADGDH